MKQNPLDIDSVKYCEGTVVEQRLPTLGADMRLDEENSFLFWIGTMTVSLSSVTRFSRPATSFQETVMERGSTSWLAINISYSFNLISLLIPRLANNFSACFLAANFCFLASKRKVNSLYYSF